MAHKATITIKTECKIEFEVQQFTRIKKGKEKNRKEK